MPSTTGQSAGGRRQASRHHGDVTLIVHNLDNSVSHTVGAQCTFHISDAPPGPAMVLVSADGFAPYLNTFDVAAGNEYNLRVGLLLAGAASGKVHGADRKPVEDAEVRATYSSSLRGRDSRSILDVISATRRSIGSGSPFHAPWRSRVPRRDRFVER